MFYLSTHVGGSDELFVNLHLAGGERYFPLRANLLLQLVDESSTRKHHVRLFETLKQVISHLCRIWMGGSLMTTMPYISEC